MKMSLLRLEFCGCLKFNSEFLFVIMDKRNIAKDRNRVRSKKRRLLQKPLCNLDAESTSESSTDGESNSELQSEISNSFQGKF